MSTTENKSNVQEQKTVTNIEIGVKTDDKHLDDKISEKHQDDKNNDNKHPLKNSVKKYKQYLYYFFVASTSLYVAYFVYRRFNKNK